MLLHKCGAVFTEDSLIHTYNLAPPFTPSPPSGAERVGVRWGAGYGPGTVEIGGVSGRMLVTASQNVAKASDSTVIGIPARA